jgi:hypothetical protein
MVSRMQALSLLIAAWADRWLIPAVMSVLLLSDFVIGLIWVISPTESFSSPVFDAAKKLFSLDAYGIMMMLSVVICAVGFATVGRSWITGWLSGPLIAGQWMFWSLLFIQGAIGRVGGSLTLAVFAMTAALLHCLVGLGIASSIYLPEHRPHRRSTDPRR